MSQMRLRRARYAVTWLLLALGITVGIGSLNWPTYRRLAARGVSAQAVVVELLPRFHDTVRYRYDVAGRTFEGQTQSWQPNPPSEKLRIGQPLVIYYDPGHPSTSVLGDPKPILENETISVLLAAFGMPTFVVVVWILNDAGKRRLEEIQTLGERFTAP
jgi:hypothetical protein